MWPWCDLVAFTSAPDCLLHSVQSKLLWACACRLPDGDSAPFCIRSHLNDCEVDLKTSRQIRDFPPQRFSSGHTKGLPIGIILSFVLLTSMKLPSLVYVLLNFCLTFFLLYIVTILGDDAYLVKVLSSLVEDTLSSPSWNGYNWQWVQKGCCCSVLGCISTFEIMFTAEESSVIYWGVAGNLQERLCFNQINKFIHLALSVFECLCWLVRYTAHLVTFFFFFFVHNLLSSSPSLEPLLLFLHHINCLLLMLNRELVAFL